MCHRNPRRMLFYLKGKFILIAYHYCMEFGDEYQYKMDLIKQIISDNKVYLLSEVNKSVRVEEELKEFRLRNRTLRKVVQEVNYIYCDNAQRFYAITTTIPFIDAITSDDSIFEEYKKAKICLIESGLENLLPELNQLMVKNCVYSYISNSESVKTVEFLIDQINNYANGNNEESINKGTSKTRLQHDDVIESKGNRS